MNRVAVRGAWGTVEWATDENGSTPAKAAFENLDVAAKAKIFALFRRLADFGQISNREKFKSLGKGGEHLWEFKSFQDRFLGDFRPGKRFLVAAFVKKKQDKLDPVVIARAVRVLSANDDMNE